MRRSGYEENSTIKFQDKVLKNLSDAELVEMVRVGRPDAYQVLVDRYENLVRSVVAKCLRNDSMTIEDACQETFLKALVRINDLRNTARFKSWLCAIAHNQALDTLRRRKRLVSWNSSGGTGSSRGEENQPMWQIPDTKANPAERHMRSEADGVVWDIVMEMPDLYREPIHLRYQEDLDYQEIADILDKPLGTVKSLIHRAKALIKVELTRRAGGKEGAMLLAS